MIIHSLSVRELNALVDDNNRKLEESQSKITVLQSGSTIHTCVVEVCYMLPYIALESTQSELFELKNKQDDMGSAR